MLEREIRYKTIYNKFAGLVIADMNTNPRIWSAKRYSDEEIVDLLNQQDETLEKIKKKSKEFKEHIQSEIRVAKHQIENGEKINKEHWIVRQNAYEELLEEMPWLLVWEGEIE